MPTFYARQPARKIFSIKRRF